MPKADISLDLDAEPVVELMVLAGVGSPQDAVEAVVRDHITRGHRTEGRTERKDQQLREADVKPQEPQAELLAVHRSQSRGTHPRARRHMQRAVVTEQPVGSCDITSDPGFACSCCGTHRPELPMHYTAKAPAVWDPAFADAEDCLLSSDRCVIDAQHCFVKGLIEIPVIGSDEVFPGCGGLAQP